MPKPEKKKDDVNDADDDVIKTSDDDKSSDEGALVKVKKVGKVGKEKKKQNEKSKVTAKDISIEGSDSNSESDSKNSLESPKTPKTASKSIPQKVTPPLVAVTPQNCIRAPFSRRSGQSNAVKMPPKEQMSKPVKKPVPTKPNKKIQNHRCCLI